MMARRFLRWLWATEPPSPDFEVPVCTLALLMCAMFGVAFVLGGGKDWWWEQFYESEGVRTDSGLVIARRKVTREGDASSTITEHFFRYRFQDQFGRAHEFEGISQNPSQPWSESDVGTRLPMIEYLASDPRCHRLASAKGLGRKLFWTGVGLLVAIIPVRLIYGIAMWFVFGHWPRLMTQERDAELRAAADRGD